MRASDTLFLQAAIELAEEGRFTCAPNPTVGCVIVRGQEVIGRGFHARHGSGHAEVNAIADAGGLSEIAGATAYVSLEPCSFVSKTPACAATLIEGRIGRVVAALVDPHPRVSGSGMKMLTEEGIQADVIELPEAARLIEGYVTRVTKKRPFVRLKTASSLDGATALANGESQWITSAEARTDVQYWRARSDAIVTGVGTVLADDPALTVRDERFAHANAPLRVVLDRSGRMPADAAMLHDEGPTHVTADGLDEMLRDLAERGCNEVLVEAGAAVVGSFVDAGLWDEWLAYLAPKVLGAKTRGVADFEIASLAAAIDGEVVAVDSVGPDLRVTLRRRG